MGNRNQFVLGIIWNAENVTIAINYFTSTIIIMHLASQVNSLAQRQTCSMDNLHPPRRESLKAQQNEFSIILEEELYPHDPAALMKCAEVLTLLVRDAAHITPYNFDSCVHALRVFVEASMHNATGTYAGWVALNDVIGPRYSSVVAHIWLGFSALFV